MVPRQKTRTGRSTQTLLRLGPGTRLVEREMVERLGVSRTGVRARVVSGATNMTRTRWTQRADPDGLLYILFHSKGFANTMKYRNEQVDSLLDQARTAYDIPDGAIVRCGIRGVAGVGERLRVDSRSDSALPRSVEGRLSRRG